MCEERVLPEEKSHKENCDEYRHLLKHNLKETHFVHSVVLQLPGADMDPVVTLAKKILDRLDLYCNPYFPSSQQFVVTPHNAFCIIYIYTQEQ